MITSPVSPNLERPVSEAKPGKKAASPSPDEPISTDAFQALLSQAAPPMAPAIPAALPTIDALNLPVPQQNPGNSAPLPVLNPGVVLPTQAGTVTSAASNPAATSLSATQISTNGVDLTTGKNAAAKTPASWIREGSPAELNASAPQDQQIPALAQWKEPALNSSVDVAPVLAPTSGILEGSKRPAPTKVPNWLKSMGPDLTHAPAQIQNRDAIDLQEVPHFEDVLEKPVTASSAGPIASLGGSSYLGVLSALKDKSAALPASSVSQQSQQQAQQQASQIAPMPPLPLSDRKKASTESALVFNPAQAQISNPAQLGFSAKAVPMRGDVIPGGAAEARLAKVSVMGMSTQIRDFSRSGGSGEMRLRLNPENLGEVRVVVNSDGRDVSLRIHAADQNSKKIIESSLGDLRDGLSLHQLNLGRVEVSVAQPQQSSLQADAGGFSQDQFSQQAANSGWAGDLSGGQNSSGDSRTSDRPIRSTSNLATVAQANAQRNAYRNVAPGRLDVVA